MSILTALSSPITPTTPSIQIPTDFLKTTTTTVTDLFSRVSEWCERNLLSDEDGWGLDTDENGFVNGDGCGVRRLKLVVEKEDVVVFVREKDELNEVDGSKEVKELKPEEARSRDVIISGKIIAEIDSPIELDTLTLRLTGTEHTTFTTYTAVCSSTQSILNLEYTLHQSQNSEYIFATSSTQDSTKITQLDPGVYEFPFTININNELGIEDNEELSKRVLQSIVCPYGGISYRLMTSIRIKQPIPITPIEPPNTTPVTNSNEEAPYWKTILTDFTNTYLSTSPPDTTHTDNATKQQQQQNTTLTIHTSHPLTMHHTNLHTPTHHLNSPPPTLELQTGFLSDQIRLRYTITYPPELIQGETYKITLSLASTCLETGVKRLKYGLKQRVTAYGSYIPTNSGMLTFNNEEIVLSTSKENYVMDPVRILWRRNGVDEMVQEFVVVVEVPLIKNVDTEKGLVNSVIGKWVKVEHFVKFTVEKSDGVTAVLEVPVVVKSFLE